MWCHLLYNWVKVFMKSPIFCTSTTYFETRETVKMNYSVENLNFIKILVNSKFKGLDNFDP